MKFENNRKAHLIMLWSSFLCSQYFGLPAIPDTLSFWLQQYIAISSWFDHHNHHHFFYPHNHQWKSGEFAAFVWLHISRCSPCLGESWHSRQFFQRQWSWWWCCLGDPEMIIIIRCSHVIHAHFWCNSKFFPHSLPLPGAYLGKNVTLCDTSNTEKMTKNGPIWAKNGQKRTAENFGTSYLDPKSKNNCTLFSSIFQYFAPFSRYGHWK